MTNAIGEAKRMPDLSLNFPTYEDFNPKVPVFRVTSPSSSVIHRFFDTSPFSPSGRYLALTQFPFENRLLEPGEAAQILLIDLGTGEQEIVAETHGWDTQLGAQVQWGIDDCSLFFNDVDVKTWTPFGVKLNPFTKQREELEGTIYMVSPDGNWTVSPCLLRTGTTQPGYGVIVPAENVPTNDGASSNDGLYLTSTQTGKRTLLVSFKEIFESAFPPNQKDKYREGAFYGFHAKWNPQGTRLMFVVRWLPRRKGKPRLNSVITMDVDGSNIRMAIPDSEWRKGGHHPNWCPDGDHVMMNLNLKGAGLRFVRARYDGSGLCSLNDSLLGSGHPTMHPDERHILTDAYCHEPLAFGDGTTPIRWIDLKTGEEECLVRIRTLPDYPGKTDELRVDPHPAWDRDFKRFAFNACPGGKRGVFVAELER